MSKIKLTDEQLDHFLNVLIKVKNLKSNSKNKKELKEIVLKGYAWGDFLEFYTEAIKGNGNDFKELYEEELKRANELYDSLELKNDDYQKLLNKIARMRMAFEEIDGEELEEIETDEFEGESDE